MSEHDFSPWKSRYLTVNGLRLHYLDWGNDKTDPLLFLHGLRSLAHTFDPFAATFRPHFHVLALDQRGHGESDRAGDGYGEEQYVSDVEGFVRVLRLRPVALIGHSMGARNAWAYAAANPRRVKKLALIDLGPEVSRQVVQQMRHSLPPETFDSRDDAFDFLRAANPRPGDDMVRLRVLHNLRQLPDADARSGRWAWRYDPALRDPQRMAPPARPEDDWRALARIACETLVMRGAESELLSPEVAERMAETLPRGRLVTIPGAGHTVAADRPEEFAAALKEFLGLPAG